MPEEVSELSTALIQMREMLLQIAHTINQDSQFTGPAVDGGGSDGCSQREEVSLATKDLNKT